MSLLQWLECHSYGETENIQTFTGGLAVSLSFSL